MWQDNCGRNAFPRPVQVLEGGRAVAWPESEIAAYVESRIAARDAAAPNLPPVRGRRDDRHQP
jgi:hypothetical protein